ncbi:EsaB/YukD family protein, partial [Kitasatospora sp. NPDC093558]|uniref:EsaB/YukD family protein n=1 Tax=Kitasatospora sp. NPDC093558 TaxID=3155201 RepID=UPI003424274F
MSTSAVAGLCRLRFQAPEAVFELAVPADVPLADLLPAIIGHAGPGLAESGLEHGGWVLQRLGEEPLDEEQSAEALGLHDGDALYLRPRHEALPPVHFDDLVDGVATGVQERGDTWRPALTRRLALALAVAALAAGWIVLALPGPAAPREAAAAGVAVLVL